MKSKGLILTGILLTCLAFLMFIYVLEAETVFKTLPSVLTHAGVIKHIGYLVAVVALVFLFAGLIVIYKARAVFDALYAQRNQRVGKRPDELTTISVVRFGCLNCKNRITAEFLPNKDSVQCPHCGVVNLVPAEAVASAEDVLLQSAGNVVSYIMNAAGDSDRLPFFIKVLAWVNLVLPSAAGAFLLIKGMPVQVDKSIVWGLSFAYAGIIIAAMLFSLSAISVNLNNRAHREAEYPGSGRQMAS